MSSFLNFEEKVKEPASTDREVICLFFQVMKDIAYGPDCIKEKYMLKTLHEICDLLTQFRPAVITIITPQLANTVALLENQIKKASRKAPVAIKALHQSWYGTSSVAKTQNLSR